MNILSLLSKNLDFSDILKMIANADFSKLSKEDIEKIEDVIKLLQLKLSKAKELKVVK